MFYAFVNVTIVGPTVHATLIVDDGYGFISVNQAILLWKACARSVGNHRIQSAALRRRAASVNSASSAIHDRMNTTKSTPTPPQNRPPNRDARHIPRLRSAIRSRIAASRLWRSTAQRCQR